MGAAQGPEPIPLTVEVLDKQQGVVFAQRANGVAHIREKVLLIWIPAAATWPAAAIAAALLQLRRWPWRRLV